MIIPSILEKLGRFKQGAWIVGIDPSLIGKKIIRTEPCRDDYSYCLKGYRTPYQNPEYNYIILKEIDKNGCIIFQHPRLGNKICNLESCWTDGNWIEYIPGSKQI